MDDEVHRGISATSLGAVARRGSGALGHRVETVPPAAATCDFRLPTGPAPVHSRAEIAAPVAGAKDGEFDDFLD